MTKYFLSKLPSKSLIAEATQGRKPEKSRNVGIWTPKSDEIWHFGEANLLAFRVKKVISGCTTLTVAFFDRQLIPQISIFKISLPTNTLSLVHYVSYSMDTSLVTLSEYLNHTLSPDDSIRRPAEQTLETLQTQPGYSLLLLQLLKESSVLSHTSHSAAIAFKNFVKKYWDLEEETNPLSPQDRIVSFNILLPLEVSLDIHLAKSIAIKYVA